MDEFGELAVREREARRIARRQWFWLHFVVYATIQIFLLIVWTITGHNFPWFVFPLFGWGIFVAGHAAFAYIVRDPEEIMVERERKKTETEK